MRVKAKKNRSEFIRDRAKDFMREIRRKQFTLAEFADWLIENKHWQFSKLDQRQACRRECATALRTEKDTDGDRTFIDAQLPLNLDGEERPTRYYAPRVGASWELRQRYLEEQINRLAEFKSAVLRFRDKLNAERAKGEPMFQIHLAFDQ